MDAHRLPGCAGFALAMTLCPHAQGAECPREDALGKSRIIAVAVDEIDKGIAAVEMALNGVSTTIPSMPFFRFPGFLTNRQTLDDLQQRRIVVFDADIIADDWIAMTREAELNLLTARLKAAGKGIILPHDPKAQTAAVLPAFLRYLRDNGHSVVHVVPEAESRPAADVEQSEKRE